MHLIQILKGMNNLNIIDISFGSPNYSIVFTYSNSSIYMQQKKHLLSVLLLPCMIHNTILQLLRVDYGKLQLLRNQAFSLVSKFLRATIYFIIMLRKFTLLERNNRIMHMEQMAYVCINSLEFLKMIMIFDYQILLCYVARKENNFKY